MTKNKKVKNLKKAYKHKHIMTCSVSSFVKHMNKEPWDAEDNKAIKDLQIERAQKRKDILSRP